MHELPLETENQDQWAYLTVGQLRKVIANLPDDAPVYYERIEDVYFERYRWATTKTPDPLHRGTFDEHVRAFEARFAEGRLLLTAHY